MDKQRLLLEDPDFIISPKHQNSLNRLIEEYPDGVPPHIICKVLNISQQNLDSLYKSAIMKLQKTLVLQNSDSPSSE